MLNWRDIGGIFFHGGRMDLSMAGYLTILMGLFTAFYYSKKLLFIKKFAEYYTLILLILISLLQVADMELYRYWGFKLDASAFEYLANPDAVAGSADIGRTLSLLTMALALIIVSYIGYKRKVSAYILKFTENKVSYSLKMFFLTALLFVPIRGTFGKQPMSLGFVYFHPNNLFANHSAVNVPWNVIKSAMTLKKTTFPENFYDKLKTETYYQQLYAKTTPAPKLLKTDRPNVVIICLESFAAKMIGSLGCKDTTITPRINALSKEGILFANFYANGDRTVEGCLSVLSGYPGLPKTELIRYENKTQNLPFLSQDFHQAGYYTGMTFGYDLEFAHFGSYFNSGYFDVLTHKTDFPLEVRHEYEWGVHDHHVLEKISSQLDQAPQPFFWFSMTLSSHEPYTVPMETVIKGNDEASMFKNCAFYSDKCVGEFIDRAKKSSWWDNTLIILVADHSSRHPIDIPDQGQRILNLWLGGALSVKDTVIHTFGTQCDIANTLLNQTNIRYNHYPFSRDLFSPDAQSFAFYTFTNGFRYLNEKFDLEYSLDANKFLKQQGTYTEEDLNKGKAILQKLYLETNALSQRKKLVMNQ
ncbi:MAG: alkaline phosphatase family protein [Flammeovirgaceae bacterium]